MSNFVYPPEIPVVSSLPSASSWQHRLVVYNNSLYFSNGTSWYNLSSSSSTTPFPFWSFPPKPPNYNEYCVPYSIGGTAATTLTLTANRIYWIPFSVDRDVYITEVAINVTASGTGTAYVGLYNSDDRFQPYQQIWVSSDINVGTAGVRAVTNNLPVALSVGVYWFALVCTSAATVRAIALASLRALALPNLGTANLCYWYTSGSSLPTTAPTSGYTGATGATPPAIGVKYTL